LWNAGELLIEFVEEKTEVEWRRKGEFGGEQK
jgi:hypothetical protein